MFGRLPNGVGHRQVAMELRAVDGERIADKTVLKMMREMGLRCGIRRGAGRRGYSSYKGVVGKTFENVLGRDFSADGPWRKMGTDVTEFRLSFGKAYLAPVYDFGSKEIVAWSVSERPGLAQQEEMLAMLMAAKPDWALIPSTYFSPIAQTNRRRSRQRAFTRSANALSPFSANRRPSSRAAGPSAGRTCP
ncbi:hypothetical protein [[Collinsella] massiliensis]|uniref:hypothetical protein n=1 Tax=[Collinsella] massiliensis TaxID=1232426 RepID=UPI00315DB291